MPAPEPFVEPRSGAEFVPVPAGSFRMGSEEVDEDALPLHQVELRDFWMSRFEVTHAQYARFLAATKRPTPKHWTHKNYSAPSKPVIGVDYADAAAYCQWVGGRLPTEAEWEYATRGTDGRPFPWGKELPDASRAVHHRDVGFGFTLPVGSAPRGVSPFGIHDLAGNVFEWCADWYEADYYAHSPAANPPGPEKGRLRVVRGGAWISLPDACHAAARGKVPPETRSALIGVRVIRDSAPKPASPRQ